MTSIKFTKITSKTGPLTKELSLDDTGNLVKKARPQLSSATFEVCEIKDLSEFSGQLEAATPDTAFTYGISVLPSGRIVRDQDVQRNPGAISRTRQHFGWANTCGILMLDNDIGDIDRRSFDEVLRDDAGIPENVSMLLRPSSSSLIYNSESGECLRGVQNQRAYIVVSDASKIPQIGQAIDTYLWAAGHGYYQSSSAGTALRRNLIDTSVWQPERLDFVGGAVCIPPLEQCHLLTEYIEGSELILDSSRMVMPSDRVIACAKTNQAKELSAIKDDLKSARETYVERQTQRYRDLGGSEEAAVLSITNALDRKTLDGGFVIQLHDGTTTTVAEVLSNPGKFNGVRCCDPIEPEYQNDSRVAIICVQNGSHPYIYSHAHGGCRYKLLKNPKTIQIFQGQSARAADDVSAHLANSRLLFDRGQTLVSITDDGQARQANSASIQYIAGTECNIVSYDNRSNKLTERDLSDKTASFILSRAGHGVFPELSAIITAPTMTPSGTLINTPGYNPKSKLLYLSNDPEPEAFIPHKPTSQQVAQAVYELMLPFKDFPFDGIQSQSAMLAALLTAVVRPCLSTAPCFGFDAPTQGSGKTKLALCVGAIATGRIEALLPPPNEDEETRKKLATEVLSAKQVIIFDNVERQLSSPVLAAFMTSPYWSDRLLGSNTKVEGENRMLVAITGNNLSIIGDMVRRTIIIRIDPQIEASAVWKREFPFDPLDYVVRNRQRLVAAALTILQGFVVTGMPKGGPGKLASFEEWDSLVRQSVIWLAAQGHGDFCDPISRLTESANNDPDYLKLSSLTKAWHAKYSDHPLTVKELVDSSDLRLSINEIASDKSGFLNTKVFGGYLRQRQDRIVDGLKIVREKGRSNTARWRVIDTRQTPAP